MPFIGGYFYSMMTPESTLRDLGIQLAPGDEFRTEQRQVQDALAARNITVDIKVLNKTTRVRSKLVETSSTSFKIKVLHDEVLYQARWVFNDLGKISEFSWKR